MIKVQKLQFIKFKKESESTKLPIILLNQQDQLQNHVCLQCTWISAWCHFSRCLQQKDDDGELRLVASHSARGWRAKRPLRKRRRAPPPSLSWARATSYAVYSVSSLNGRPLSNFIFIIYCLCNRVYHSKLSVLWPTLLKFLMRWFLNRSNNVLEFQKCMHLENIANSRFFECRLR